jgi:hypothetical protein
VTDERTGNSDTTIIGDPAGDAETTLMGMRNGDRPKTMPTDMSEVISIFKWPFVGQAGGPNLKMTAKSGIRKNP